MPAWDDPTLKWDDPLYGFNGGTPVARVPTWSDTISTWADPGEGWNGESQSGDVQYGAPPGLYIKDTRNYSNTLQVTIVTKGVPGQPADDPNMYLKIVVPTMPMSDTDYVEYHLDSISAVPIFTVRPTNYATWSMWTSLLNEDDGKTWSPPIWWYEQVGNSVYLRSGKTIYRALGLERSYAARARLENGPWVDAFHILGVPTTLNPGLPPTFYKVFPTQYSNLGPVSAHPVGGVRADAKILKDSNQTLWRAASYPQTTITTTGGYGDISYFRTRSTPLGEYVYGYVRWEDGANYVLSSFGIPNGVPDNTAIYTNMCTIIDMYGAQYNGFSLNSIAGWTVWPMGAAGGRSVTIDTYTLAGPGTPGDPRFESTQHHMVYST